MSDMTADPRDAPATEINLEGGNRALMFQARARTPVVSMTATLGIAGPRPVLLVIGGADELSKAAEPSIRILVDDGVVPAVEAVGPVVVDGGTDAGIMALVGGAIAAAHLQVPVLGVAPRGRVTWEDDTRAGASGGTKLEPHHTHFILADSDAWGGETPLLFEVVEAIADPSRTVALVAGGGPGTVREVASAVRRGIPVIALAGSGGVADDLAEAATARAANRVPKVANPDLTAILGEIDLTVVAPDADPALLERLLLRRLQSDETLRTAWRQYRVLARTARQQQRAFGWYQRAILALGLLATILIVLQAQLRNAKVMIEGSPADQVLQYGIVLIPIGVGVLVAGAARLRPGGRWVLLRGAAEAIKRETYRYRARTGLYAPDETRRTSREVKLAAAVGSTMNALMLTDVNLAAIDAASPADDPVATLDRDTDDRTRPLGAADYIRFRIDDQVAFYRNGVRRHERRVQRLRWLMLAFGAVGSVLAVAGLQLWVAVTVAVVGVFATYLESMQLEATIMLYNQAATTLEGIRAWWTALPPDQQVLRRNFDRLVERSERVMQAEHGGWVQQMQDAMTKLHLEEIDEAASDGDTGDGSAAGTSG
jgi:hypothetical protein